MFKLFRWLTLTSNGLVSESMNARVRVTFVTLRHDDVKIFFCSSTGIILQSASWLMVADNQNEFNHYSISPFFRLFLEGMVRIYSNFSGCTWSLGHWRAWSSNRVPPDLIGVPSFVFSSKVSLIIGRLINLIWLFSETHI